MVSDREKLVLGAIIDFYLLYGETIGSRTLVKKYNIDLSSATIRNVMSDLEDRGFIAKTHTSSGRVPTDKGYKFYLEELLRIEQLSREELRKINSAYEFKVREIDSVLKKTSTLISKLTNCVGVVIEPTHRKEEIKKVELIHIDNYMALAVIIMENKTVRTKKLYFDKPCDELELQELARKINSEIKQKSMNEELGILNNLYDEVEGQLFLESSAEIFKNKQIDEITDALNIFSNKSKMKEVFETVVKSKPLKNGEVNVIFGDELEISGLEDYSFIYSVYSFDNSQGVIGVVGPKRMAYSRNIGVLKHITEEVNKAIKMIACKGDWNE